MKPKQNPSGSKYNFWAIFGLLFFILLSAGPTGKAQEAPEDLSATSPPDVFAALNVDKTKLTLSVVSPMETMQQLNIRIEGAEVGNRARAWILIPPTREQRRNQLENPVEVQEKEIRFRSSVTVEPMSITLFEMDVR